MGAATVVSTVIFMGAASPRDQFRIKVYNSGVDRERSRYPKLPFSFTSFAAPSSPVIAARYNDVARLIRRRPAASSSAPLNDLPLMPTMKLKGLDSAAQTCCNAARAGR